MSYPPRLAHPPARPNLCFPASSSIPTRTGATMFIAMNRFQVIRGSEADFETVWTSRDTHLRDVPGFVTFHLLRGPEREDHTLFASHTIWASRADFEAWT